MLLLLATLAFADPVIGVDVAASFPAGPLRGSVLPRVSVGQDLPVLAGRLRAVAIAGGTRAGRDDEAVDADIGAYSYALRRTSLQLALGARLRLLGDAEVVSPELLLAPQVEWSRVRVDGEAGDASLGRSADARLGLGWIAAAGVGARTRGGELVFHVGLMDADVRGPLTGSPKRLAVQPSVGYRLALGRSEAPEPPPIEALPALPEDLPDEAPAPEPPPDDLPFQEPPTGDLLFDEPEEDAP